MVFSDKRRRVDQDIDREIKRERDRLTELYYPRIEVKARMPVGQPVLDSNYKQLKNNTNLNFDKTAMLMTVTNIAIIIAQRRKSLKKKKRSLTSYNHQLGLQRFF